MNYNHHFRYMLRATRANRDIRDNRDNRKILTLFLTSYLLPLTFYFLPLTSYLLPLPLSAQQIQLKGVVTVQNSKTYTGKTQFVKNAEVEHVSANNVKTKDVTGDDGKFLLNIKGAAPNTQTQITVTPFGDFSDFVVVNEKEIKDITLGRITPVSVYICKKGELEQRQADMVGINMKKLEERLEKDKKRLQMELEQLKANNDYLNARFSEIKDSLAIISNSIDIAFERIKEYAKIMVLENLDEREENYVRAYNCFSRGDFDSVPYYLPDHELELKYQKIKLLQKETQKKKELVEKLTESIRTEEEYSQNSLNELLKNWVLLARTYNMKNDYEKTMFYYEKVFEADSLNVELIIEYADYLQKIRYYNKAETFYLKCLEIISNLVKHDTKAYLPSEALVLNNLGLLYWSINDHEKALQNLERVLFIRRELAAENPKLYRKDVAWTLNHIAILLQETRQFDEALVLYEETLEFFREFAAEDSSINNVTAIASILINLGTYHADIEEFPTAVKECEEALDIYNKLNLDEPKFVSNKALVLNNLGAFYLYVGEFEKAIEALNESLTIRKKLAADNPKVYLPDVVQTLANLGFFYSELQENEKAFETLGAAISLIRELITDTPNDFFYYMALCLFQVADLHFGENDYSKSLEEYNEGMIYLRKLVAHAPEVYSHIIPEIIKKMIFLHIEIKEYSTAIQYLMEIVQPPYESSGKTITKILENFEELEKAGVISEESMKNLEIIREMLKK